ncbi:MAG: SDR family NAD(P)-dependent oxidoreductase, partial [Clostridiales bacterium]|nr:SDR family NAD(P)-dependent oxidoreductase [Clostridiales bacterium]
MKKSGSRIVVISGTSSGIGKELCSLYRNAGDTVIGLSRRGGDGDCEIKADVTDYAAVERAVDDIAARYGRIDIVIANAGGGLSGATELLPLDEVQAQMSLNFTGALNLVRCALKYMQSGGKAVFISSACALFALPYRATYCASKAALNM